MSKLDAEYVIRHSVDFDVSLKLNKYDFSWLFQHDTK